MPTARNYDPGTNVLVTTWHTPSGWLEVRDALTMAPRTGADETTPHTRPPADDDAEHLFVRTAVCLSGSVEVEVVCEPAFDYGRAPATWTIGAADGRSADAVGAGQTIRLHSDLALGVEGNAVVGRHVLQAGESRLLRPVVVERPGRAGRLRRRGSAGWSPPLSSGDGGWAGRGSPTTRCARTSSARR